MTFSAVAVSEAESARIDALLSKLAEGEIAAMGPIYDVTRTSVYAYALSLLKNAHEAEDVMHDCYLKLYSAAPGYTPKGKPLAFILTIARNLCYDRINEAKKTAPIPEEAWETLLKTEEIGSNLEIAEQLRILADDERQIVLLHAVAGFKHRETARLMQLPLSTVLSKYSRAIRKLREHITERDRNYE